MAQKKQKRIFPASQAGFTLLESLITIVILVIAGGVVMSGMTGTMKTQRTIQNRTEMHSNVRNVTELLAQEIGQAGRVSWPNPAASRTLGGAVLAPVPPADCLVQTVAVFPDTSGMFNGEYLVIDAGSAANVDLEETVKLTQAPNGSITACFAKAHPAGAPVRVQGGFATGIVPPAPGEQAGWPGFGNGSRASTLKLYGDINGDGNMVYVEYDCNPNATGTGTLTRSVTPIVAGVAGLTQSQVLLDNLAYNNNPPTAPGGTPCFSYQPTNPVQTDVFGNTYVLDVAVTLTVKTQNRDAQTNQFQYETKALLNISPRNVYQTWQGTNFKANNRAQPMPADPNGLNVQAMLAMTPPAAQPYY
jgi:prepilin-type N-terminal cleavage/methylation domain-containing protein